MTAREAILAAVATLLANVPNATYFRSRQAAFARSEGNCITSQPEEEPSEFRSAGMDIENNKLTFVVTFVVRDDIPDRAADPIIQAAHALIMRDTTLGSLCARLIKHSTKWDFEVADLTGAAIEVRYVAQYQTRASDLSALT